MWSLEDDPVLRSSFMGVTLLDQPPDFDRFCHRMSQAVEGVPSLAERVVPAPLGLAAPHWEHDPHFDLDRHVRRVTLAAPATVRQLLELAAQLCAAPFDRDRPLWEFTIVEGLEDGRAALLAKMHHVLSDGVGAIRISTAFLDLSAEGESLRPPRAARPPATGPTVAEAARPGDTPHAGGTDAGGTGHGGTDGPGRPVLGDLLGAVAGALGTVVSVNVELTRRSLAAAVTTTAAVSKVARDPGGAISTSVSTARSLSRQIGIIDPARSPLWSGHRTMEHHFDILSIDLARTREVAKALGGTVNDAFVTMMADAAGAYHRAFGEPVAELRITMPISVRTDKTDGGNAWVPARLLVPTGEMPASRRFNEVSARLGGVKKEPSLGMGGTLAGVIRRLPAPVMHRFARQQVSTVDFACSNVRGAPFDVWIAGGHVEANHPLGPTAGVAFNATVMSYKECLNLGLNCDTGAITDPGLLRRCITSAVADLHAAA